VLRLPGLEMVNDKLLVFLICTPFGYTICRNVRHRAASLGRHALGGPKSASLFIDPVPTAPLLAGAHTIGDGGPQGLEPQFDHFLADRGRRQDAILGDEC
jgi:hypothetical protein